jgi:hypothetical protein
LERGKYRTACVGTKAVEHRRTLKRVAQNNLIRVNASALQRLTF